MKQKIWSETEVVNIKCILGLYSRVREWPSVINLLFPPQRLLPRWIQMTNPHDAHRPICNGGLFYFTAGARRKLLAAQQTRSCGVCDGPSTAPTCANGHERLRRDGADEKSNEIVGKFNVSSSDEV